MQARLVFRNEDEKARAQRTGVTDLKRRYDLNDLASTHAIFVATGVTNGALVKGVSTMKGYITTETLLMNSATGTVAKLLLKTRR